MKTSSYIKISKNRYKEDKGFYYEDFDPGIIIEHTPGRSITETDNIWQSLISMNQHPVHIDKAYAENAEFKKLLVSSLVTFNIINGMTVFSISQKCIANLGWKSVTLTAPVFVGDTLYAETEILSKRESKTRPEQGIIEVKTRGFNQGKIKVIEFERTLLVPKNNKEINKK